MTSLIQEYISDEEKPICNVVIYLTEDEEPDVWDWWQIPAELGPVTNGILASGYAISTTRLPVQNADMYYIFTRGKWKWGTTLDLPDSIVQLFDSGKPVILHLTHILPNDTQNWNIVRTKLGIDSTTFDTIENADAILYGIYNGIRYPHLRATDSAQITYFNNITPANVTGEILSVGDLNGTTYVLITRNGKNYLVNGMGLEFRASFPISNALNDGLQKPTACVTYAGLNSYFYALDIDPAKWDTTEIHIKLPYSNFNQVEWFKRDFYGNSSSGIATYDSSSGWCDTLEEGTILILKSLSTGVDEQVDLRRYEFNLSQNYPNPFNRNTIIDYHLTKRCFISLKIFDLSGRLVRTLVEAEQPPGTYRVNWDGRDARGRKLSSGVYFYRLKVAGLSRIRKMVLLR